MPGGIPKLKTRASRDALKIGLQIVEFDTTHGRAIGPLIRDPEGILTAELEGVLANQIGGVIDEIKLAVRPSARKSGSPQVKKSKAVNEDVWHPVQRWNIWQSLRNTSIETIPSGVSSNWVDVVVRRQGIVEGLGADVCLRRIWKYQQD